VLEDGVSVSHTCNVVGHRAGTAVRAQIGLGADRQFTVLGGHEIHVLEEGIEELPDDAAGLGRHAQHFVVPIDVLTQKLHQLHVLLRHAITQIGERVLVQPHVIDGAGLQIRESRLGRANQIHDDEVDHATDDLVDQPAFAEPGIARNHRFVLPAKQTHLAQIAHADELCAQAVVDIVVVVGDLIGKVGDLRLEPRLAPVDESLAELAKLAGVAQRTVLENALAAFESQVQPGKLCIALFELIDYAQ